MPAFDALEFVTWLTRRWKVVAGTCLVAVAAAAGLTALQPERYTSTAIIAIQPPAGNDPRAALAVSPVYLESLKSYERFASTDALFQRALARTKIAEASGTSPDQFKRQSLKVSKPAGLAVLEISVSLREPRDAQALARAVAEEAVALNRAMAEQTAGDSSGEYRTQLAAARARLELARKAQQALSSGPSVENLEGDVQEAFDLRYRLERDLALSRTQPETAGTASATALRGQIAELNVRIAKQSSLLADRTMRRQAVDTELRAAEAAVETASNKLNDTLSTAQFRGERLVILDSGTLPAKPSSPNMPLNLLAAFLVAAAGSLLYLVIQFTAGRLTHARAESSNNNL